MAILGISAHYHDSAAALVADGVPVCAVQEERLSRRKNDAAFPLAAIEWCLDRAGVRPDQLEAVVFYEKPMLKFERILTMALRGFPRSWGSFPQAMKNALGDKLWVKGTIAAELGVPGDRILFTEHHRAHAAAAFFGAPTRKAAILTADGVGEWATLTLGRGSIADDGSASLELVRELRFPHSLGMLYSTFTAYLGFPVNEGEYKVMGLASYGKPAFEAQLRRVLRRTPDGGFALDLSYFEFHEGARRSFSDRLVAELGPPRDPWDPIDQGRRGRASVGRSVQVVLEDARRPARSFQRDGAEDFCPGGGVARTAPATAHPARVGAGNLFVPSAPGDAGCALGAPPPSTARTSAAHRKTITRTARKADAGELARLAQETG
jgi:carbamoyltransferase